MWDYEDMLGKARAYFVRAAEHEQTDDDEFVIWHLLGLEFLLRAPLAKIHPSLLAAPEGDSLLAANGLPSKKEPMSVPTHTVLSRLTQIVPGFIEDRVEESKLLMGFRNAELHTAEATAANLSNDVWLPKLLRVANVICDHLDLPVDDVLADDVVELARQLVDQEDKKLAHEVVKKIEFATAFLAGLSEEERQARTPATPTGWGSYTHSIQCPACTTLNAITLQFVRNAAEHLRSDGAGWERQVVYVATGYSCPVCSLQLNTTAEVVAAGLPQQFIDEEFEEFEDRYMSALVDDDYGND
ncbi:hypothetical protein [Nocardioides massiliensis]|uniref:Formate dehydrogenase accessory protein FdhE n=1 Tax=Nocardioides massiliensis TaxID=1325935 RepID=A0ABT9NKU8_9ACTN|nr:hypothetical protein [Nocardioides massiliensis]MDP9821051.1 hypothetical protein [Nocardioides massiliensis]